MEPRGVGQKRWTEYVHLRSLQRAPRNPKLHDHDLLGASMRRHGFVEAPTIDERTGRLVAGHGRLDELEALRDRGDEPPEGIESDGSDWLVPVQRGWSSESDAEAEAYLITSNESTMAPGWADERQLAAMLSDLREVDGGLDGTGYDQARLDALLASVAEPVAPEQFPSYDDDIETEHECPKCGYTWSGSSGRRDTGGADG